MEKHILSSSLMLNNDHQKIVDDVKKWLKIFSTSSIGLKMGSKINLNDLFIGYNDDTIATIVLNLFQGNSNLIENMEDDSNNESSSNIFQFVRIQMTKIIFISKKILNRDTLNCK